MLRYIITLDTDVPETGDYTGVTADEAAQAGVELPIDTDEKKAAMERYFTINQHITVQELVEIAGEFTVTVTVVDDPTDPDYVRSVSPT